LSLKVLKSTLVGSANCWDSPLLITLGVGHCCDLTIIAHCKKMGAEPGRRFLKQPTAKLEPVIVVHIKLLRC